MTKREGYLRLAGTTGLITQSGALNVEVLEPTGSKHISLFGSDYVQTPGDATKAPLLFKHIVYLRKADLVNRQIDQAAADKERYGYYNGDTSVRVVGKIGKRFGGKRSLVLGGQDWSGGEPEARLIVVYNPPAVWEGRDPHEVFFRAALQMRTKFAQNAMDTLRLIPDELRASATLITEVGTPISAYTREDVGFDIGCEFHQRVTLEPFDIENDLLPGQFFSNVGEYPVELPRNMDMERLMRIDLKAAMNPHIITDGSLLDV